MLKLTTDIIGTITVWHKCY